MQAVGEGGLVMSTIGQTLKMQNSSHHLQTTSTVDLLCPQTVLSMQWTMLCICLYKDMEQHVNKIMVENKIKIYFLRGIRSISKILKIYELVIFIDNTDPLLN